MLLLVLTGCATTPQSEVWNDISVSRLETGMTKAQVESIFGQPTRTQAFSGGRSAYVYLRSADENQTSNRLLKVVSLGIAKIVVVDALSIMFKDNEVVDFKYEERADNNMVEAGGFDG